VSALVLVPTAVLAAAADALLEHAVGHGDVAVGILALAAVGVSALGYYFLKGVLAHLVMRERDGRRPPRLLRLVPQLPYLTMAAVDISLSFLVAGGLVLLIVPGLILGTWFALAPILVEVEGAGYRDSFRRSRQLVRGSFWLVFGVVGLTLVGVDLLSMPLKALGAWIFPGGAGDPFEEGFGLLLAGIIVKPIGAITTIELTLDLIAAKGRDA
jgi:hypothetical protein